MNPHYDSDKFGWERVDVEFGEPEYSFDTLIFWKTPGGIYAAHDSGCSCPTPFEAYEGDSEKEILQKLERVGSLPHAKELYQYHTRSYAAPDKNWAEVSATLEEWGLK